MDFKPFFTLQKKLDEAAYSAQILADPYFREKRIVALLVEIGELGQELALSAAPSGLKVSPSEALLEEYVDGIHFMSSMANEMNLASQIEPLIACGQIDCQLVAMFEAAMLLKYNYEPAQLYQVLAAYLGMASLLGITNSQILAAHRRKHEINQARIKNNY